MSHNNLEIYVQEKKKDFNPREKESSQRLAGAGVVITAAILCPKVIIGWRFQGKWDRNRW